MRRKSTILDLQPPLTLDTLGIIPDPLGDPMRPYAKPSSAMSFKAVFALLAAIVAASLALSPLSATAVVRRAPSAPVLQSITAGDKSFTITISAPVDPGTAAVTQYAYSLNAGSWSTLGAASIAGTPKVVTVPKNDVDYSVQVRAKNSVGWGAVLDAGVVHPVQPPFIYPGAPTIVSAYDFGCHFTRIEIVAPAVTFGKITRYRFRLSEKHPWNNSWTADGVKVIHDAFKRPFTLKVQAFNNAKYSGWGDTAEVLVENRYPNCPFYE